MLPVMRLVLALGLLLSIPAFAAGQFVSAIGDLPLMQGLDPVDTPVDFSSPSGRFVIAYAKGMAERKAVTEFYAVTLPQLGWTRTGEAGFRRENETLQIDFDETPPVLTVRFTLSPIATDKRGG